FFDIRSSAEKIPVPERVRLLDRQASAAGQIFAPAKSAFMPSMAISRRRRAYTDVFTPVSQALLGKQLCKLRLQAREAELPELPSQAELGKERTTRYR
ncbi:MAG: hypothetical protein CVV06_17805, partial [Gammaproteobacteria bacterium HGW-Gammaproteobacteria-10]